MNLDAMVQRAKAAQKIYARFTQSEVDRITHAMVDAGAKASRALAEMAVRETQMGRADSKELKNMFATRDLWNSMRGLPTCDVVHRDWERGIFEVASPVGVVAAVIPCTNPTSTALFKVLIAAKTRNAVVASPHPRSQACIRESIRILREAAERAGAPEGLFLCLENPTLEDTQRLMTHEGVNLILATGGSGLVKAAYSSGKPAYGVGPGNVPVYIDSSAHLDQAAADLVESQTFDWGTLCSSEQALVVHRSVAAGMLQSLQAAGAHMLEGEDARKMGRAILKGQGINPAIVGQSPDKLAALAGIRIPPRTNLLLARETGVGPDHPFSFEKLCPVLAWYEVGSWQEGCQLSIRLLEFGGLGHTLGIHANDQVVIEAFALEKPVSRVIVNGPTSKGAVGVSTHLEPSLTLGCGSMGSNISSDNIGPRHLINLRRVAWRRGQGPEIPEALDPRVRIVIGEERTS
ncbi:MAG: aldehyde dehydrogenase family protein [Planctomycetota bacterium]